MGHVGSSKDGTEAGPSAAAMGIDDDEDIDLGDVDLDPTNAEILEELGEDIVKYWCKKASMLFFNEYGLISHQINSFNHFIHTGLQKTFESFGDLVVTEVFVFSLLGRVEPGRYD